MAGIASCLTDACAGDLVLRVRGPDQPPREVRLGGPKCLIGSGPQCVLRLLASGVQPVHCMVLRGPRAAVVRRMSADTLLNGQSFTDADLNEGDRLRVGPVEVDVLHLALPPAPSPAPPAPAPTPDKSGCPAPELPGASQRPENPARQHGRDRTRRLIAELRKARQEIDRICEAQAQTAAERRRADEAQKLVLGLQERIRDLEARAAEPSPPAASRDDNHSARLHATQLEVEEERAALRQERERWEAQRAETEERLNRRQREIDTREAKLEAQSKTSEEQRRRWDTDREKREKLLDERSALLDAREADMAEQEEALGQRQMAASGGPPPEPEAPSAPVPQERLERHTRPPEPRSQTSAAEVLSRLGMMPDLDEDKPQEHAPPAVSSPPASPRASQAPHAEGHEDESIDSYMERLMARVRGSSGGSGVPAAAPPAPEREKAARAAPPPATEAPPAAAEPGPAPAGSPRKRGSASMAPRAVAPEKTIDLSAMRELANQSAWTALERHHRRTTASAVRAKLWMAAFSLAAGCAMLWLAVTRPSASHALYASIGCFAVAGLWGLQYLVLGTRLVVRKLGSHGLYLGRPAERQSAEGGDCPTETPEQ